jgi:hypothetical protein
MPKKELDPEKIQEKIKKLEEKLESVEQDVYSPEAQAAFKDYEGTRERFDEEKRLRQIASGRGRETGKSKFLSVLAAAAFGDSSLTEQISKKYSEKYSKEEIENAKKVLEEQFGVKKKEDQDELIARKFRETIKEEISPIEKAVAGIAKSVDVLEQDIQRTNRSIKSISDNLIGTINKTLTVLAGGKGDLDRTPDKMKPVSVADEEGKEYLYYPDAPPGRQLYEKSKTGTAGRIASKKVQRELDSEIKRINRESDLQPVRAGTGDADVDSIVDQIKVLIEEEGMFRKRDMEKLIGDLQTSLAEREKYTILGVEPDEQEVIMANAMKKALDKTLYNALKDVFEKNPELLSGGGLLSGLLGAGLAAAGIGAGSAALNAAGGAAAGAAASKTGILSRLASVVSVPVLGALAATGAIFGGIDYGLKQSGDKAIRNISKGSAQDIATAIQVPKYGPYTLQELEKMAVDDPALKTKLNKAKELAGIVKASTKPDLTLSQPERAMGEQIVDQNQKRIEIQSADRVEIPAQTVTNVTNNSVIPIPSGKKAIEVHNNENTFNRLLAQEFDHPATYTSMNMG